MAYSYNPYGGYGVPSYPMYQQAAQQSQAMQQPGVTVRLVTSRDEATTAQIPFDNTINVFVNLSAGEIYIKRFNPNTGGAWFSDYVDAAKAQQIAQDAAKPQQEYATVEMLNGLRQRVDELAEAMTSKRTTRGAKADE